MPVNSYLFGGNTRINPANLLCVFPATAVHSLVLLAFSRPGSLETYGMNVDEDKYLTGKVIGAAISVHRVLGPGADEAAYEEALSMELTNQRVAHTCQKPLPLQYKGTTVDCGFRLDMVVEDRLPLELKVVEVLLPVHNAQLLTYMRLGKYALGLLINFEVALLKDGLQRMVLTRPPLEPLLPPAPLDGRFDQLSGQLLHAALEVHKTLGPGLLRTAYEECLCQELSWSNLTFHRDVNIPLRFGGCQLAHTLKAPLVIEGQVPVFCLSVAALTPLHEARLLACLRQAAWSFGLLFNFSGQSLEIRRLTR